MKKNLWKQHTNFESLYLTQIIVLFLVGGIKYKKNAVNQRQPSFFL